MACRSDHPDYKHACRGRVGHLRIVYEVLDERLVVHVIRIGHRCDVYRHLGFEELADDGITRTFGLRLP